MRTHLIRRAGTLALASALVLTACGDDDDQALDATSTTSTTLAGDMDDMDAADGGGHSHAVPFEATDPVPTVQLEVVEDAKSGFNVHVETTDFTFAPEKVNDTETESGEGHAHIYVDGEKVARLYGPWFHLGMDLEPGEHEVRVELNANDHRPYASGDAPIEATTTIVVGDAGSQTDAPDESMPDDSPTADAMVLEVDVTGGEVTGGGRHPVDLGETVTIRVTSDVADHIHLHGYDVLADVGAGDTAELTFDATIPGVFELELEDSRIPLLDLEIS